MSANSTNCHCGLKEEHHQKDLQLFCTMGCNIAIPSKRTNKKTPGLRLDNLLSSFTLFKCFFCFYHQWVQFVWFSDGDFSVYSLYQWLIWQKPTNRCMVVYCAFTKWLCQLWWCPSYDLFSLIKICVGWIWVEHVFLAGSKSFIVLPLFMSGCSALCAGPQASVCVLGNLWMMWAPEKLCVIQWMSSRSIWNVA